MKKKALVTGGSRGIGAQCVRTLAEAGYEVYINYLRSEKEALKLAEETGGIPVRADVSDFISVIKMFETVGGLDLLVCNAGISQQKLFTETSPADWRRIFGVNCDSVFNCCRAAAPYMVYNKKGCIITISSMWGVTGASCEVAYSASKAAVIGFTKALAKELGPSNVRVNCIAPGVIATDMNAALSAETMDALKDETPLCTIGTPQDVANAVKFLASDEASFITGQVLNVNGGIVI